MESNAAMSAGGMYSSIGSGMLGLEMSLHHHHIPNNQNSQNPKTIHMQQQQQNPHHPMVAYVHHHDGEIQQQPQQVQLSSAKQGGYNNNNNNLFATKSKNIQSLTLSDEEEPGGGGSLAANENSADDGKRKMSPWQRMKWTDNMVRLLIMVVYYIGDEVVSEGNDPIGSGSGSGIGKKKIGAGGGGVLQKKGKWKSVSRAMMERGFYVSPQQCEDKFNDLNKRYKRVNDILGKGTACRVVENQNLLNTMDHLSPKMKEEAKKLLNSKHLFFREMCAYHNSCSHGPASVASASAYAQQSPEVAATEPRFHQSTQQQHQSQQQPQTRCLHSTENTTTNFNTKLTEDGRNRRGEEEIEEETSDDEDEEDDDYEEEDDDDVNVVEGGGGGAGGREEEEEEDDDDDDDDVYDRDERCGRKKKKKKRRRQNENLVSPLIQQLSTELRNVIGDETKSGIEKRQWMRNRLIQLEEKHVGYEYQAFELEKQRLKWVKYSSKKEREMETDKLSNERKKLENERMTLLIRQKEIELLELYHQNPRKSDPSSVTG